MARAPAWSGLHERLAQDGGNHRLLALWHVGQRVSHPVHAGAVEKAQFL
jgi:hypothetical protein